MLRPVDMMECDLPNNKVEFRWGRKTLEVIRNKNGMITIRANNVGTLVIEPEASNVITVKVKEF